MMYKLKKQIPYVICACVMFTTTTPSIVLGNYSHENELQESYSITEGRFIDFFPDENLATAMAQAMRGTNGTPQDAVTLQELNDFTGTRNTPGANILEFPNRNIHSIEGVQHLTSITSMTFSNNHIDNIEPVAGLTNLTHFYFDGNNISDLESLRGLTNLQFIILSHNEITNIEALEGLTNLSSLTIGNNMITSIEPLRGLTRIQSLSINDNMVSDLEPLKDLPWLRILSANNQSIVLEPIVQGEVTENIFIKNSNGNTPNNIIFSPYGGAYDGTSGTITWGSVGYNTLTWNETNFSGIIRQYVEEREPLEGETLIFSEDFKNGLEGWETSIQGNPPRVELDANGNHYLRLENNAIINTTVNLPQNSKIRVYADGAASPYALLRLTEVDQPLINRHDIRFDNQETITSVVEFTTTDLTEYYLILGSGFGHGWANFGNIRIYEVIEN